MMNVWVQN